MTTITTDSLEHRMEFLILIILPLVHALQIEGPLTEDWKHISRPSFFLEPPPTSRTSKTQRPVKLQQPVHNQNSRSIFSKWFLPHKSASTKTWPVAPDSIAKSAAFSYYDLHCNPCNSVPWIPIITFTQQKPIPELTHQPIPVSAFDSYYQTINDMTANLLKPVNVLPSNRLPFYVGPPVYQQHARAPTWHAGPSSIDNSISQGQSLQFGDSVPQLPHSESNNNGDVGLSNWIQDAKPVPLFHYSHSVDYPMQFMQTSSMDLLPHINPLIQPKPVYPNAQNFNPSADLLHDVSNHLEDTKYSSSENKISVTSNDTAKDSKQLKPNNSDVTNITGPTDFLTPPAITSNDDWVHAQGGQEFEIKPQEDWTFVKEIEGKSEKRKKQIQIVIPYTVNKSKHNLKQLKENSTDWEAVLKMTDIKDTSSTTVLPIIRYLRDNPTTKKQEWTDWHKLRKAIDTWTVERFSNHRYNLSSPKDITFSTSPSSKEIRKDYLHSSVTYHDDNDVKKKPDEIQNRASSGIMKSGVLTTDRESKLWKTLPLSSSSTTKEKVYIVTPIPISSYNFSSNDMGISNWIL